MTHKVKRLVDLRALVGEGAIWDDQAQVLYWIDIMSSMLYVYDPAKKKNRAYPVSQHVGTVVPRASGGLMLAVANGFATFSLKSQKLTILKDPESNLPGNRFNDGKCDPAGRFWAGTMAYENQSNQGSLYRLDPDLRVTKVLGGIAISNGIVWSQDKQTMYYIDSFAYTVRAYDYDLQSGDIGNERVVISVTDDLGVPDGMTMDREGMLWVARFGGSRVERWNPLNGELLDAVLLPASQITSCAFGGKKLDTLFITSAAIGLEPDVAAKTHAGSLFAVKPGVTGLPAYRFAG